MPRATRAFQVLGRCTRLAPYGLSTRRGLRALALVGALVLAAPASAQWNPDGPAGNVPEDIGRMAEAVNALRQQSGRAPLKLQPQLMAAAQWHAETMGQMRTLSHIGRGGTRVQDRMRLAGYETCGGGENIAFGALQTVDDVARGWYDSPGHRQILLDPEVREMGIGRAATPDGLTYWVLDVGQRPAVAPIVLNNEARATQTSQVTVYVYGLVSDECRGPARPIVQVTLANSPDFSDAQTFAYSPTLSWTLAPGEGPRTVYARLLDSSGRVLEAQDDILVSSTAPPPSTASDLSPPVQTYTVPGPNGAPTYLTVYRQTQIVPSNLAVTALPCAGSLTGCWQAAPAGGWGPGLPAPSGPPGSGSWPYR
ncbi:MAG TPA: CAP domain-containing protein [Chloroflexota bacterium]|nr:CAP domain-containing protein [Chloroflexota bacterium]